MADVYSAGTIRIGSDEMKQLGDRLNLFKKEVKAAAEFAVRAVTKWANTEAARKIASEMRIRLQIIKGRIKVTYRYVRDGAGNYGRIWIGLDNVNVRRLRPRQTSSGVSAGSRKFPSAFIVESLGGHVFKREGLKRRMTKGRYKGQMRQPIAKQSVDVQEVGKRQLAELLDEIEPKFWAVFYGRLNYAAANP